MDSERHRSEVHHADGDDPWRNVTQESSDGQSWTQVEVFLSGGAPWGFTLRGGLEHGEPLLITKVEQSSEAASAGLQVGDELVNINQVPLSGFRQEAICLVKSSHRNLRLQLRRRTEPLSRRPHSWHSTKFTEKESDTARTQAPPITVWNSRCDASSLTDLDSGWEQTNLHRVSNHFSSLGSVDSLDRVSQSQSTTSIELLGGEKRDSAYSSFSTSSGTPDFTLAETNAASTENLWSKVSRWDSGGKLSTSHSLAEAGKQENRLTYFQMPNAGTSSEGSQVDNPTYPSTSSRTSFGPVWHVPEKKKTAAPHPGPPPPIRRDDFTKSKVHERGLVLNQGPEHQDSLKADTKNLHSHTRSSSDEFNSTSKQFSVSNTEVQTHHFIPHRDQSTFYFQPLITSYPQNTRRPDCSMTEPLSDRKADQYLSQNSTPELPANRTSHQNPRKNSSTPLWTSGTEQNSDWGHSRHYGVSSQETSQNNTQPMSERSKDQGIGAEHKSVSPSLISKEKHHKVLAGGEDFDPNSSLQVLTDPKSASSDQMEHHHTDWNPVNTEDQGPTLPPSTISEHRCPLRVPDGPHHHSPVSNRISQQVTLTQQEELSVGHTPWEELPESKPLKRNDRFATALRNEIQMKKAQLQKSMSAVVLAPTLDQAEEDQDVWMATECTTPTSAHFTNTYKDHLKEAQARVLKATSFRRKDLEPISVKNFAAENLHSFWSSAQAQKGNPVPSKPSAAAPQMTRIGGRKRIPVEMKVKSFSEPDKIHKIGLKEDLPPDVKNRSSLILPKDRKSLGLRDHMPPQTHRCEPVTREHEVQKVPDPLLHQQRLGTFAEYEARWNLEKKPAEHQASGRFHSADDILDPGPERNRTSCVHERCRSSPSADLQEQIPVSVKWREDQSAAPEAAEVPAEVPAVPPPSSASEHLREFQQFPVPPGPDPDCPSRAASVSTSISTENLRPTSGSQSPTEARDHIELRTPQPLLESQRQVTAHPSATVETNPAPVPAHPEAVAVPSHRCSERSSMEARRHRSPSPHFSPQRLIDRPPPALQNQTHNRTSRVVEGQNSAVKKVPVRVVQSACVLKADKYPYLLHGEADRSGVDRIRNEESVSCVFTRQRDCDDLPTPPEYMTMVRDNVSRQPTLTAKSGGVSETEEKQGGVEPDRNVCSADVLGRSRTKTNMDLIEDTRPRWKTPTNHSLSRAENERGEVPAESIAKASTSAYYSTSAPKAELLIKMKDMKETANEPEDEPDPDLAQKKQELMDSLGRKLRVLREARQSLQEDMVDNNALGEQVEARVQQLCKPNQLDKFRMFIGDLDKVLSLMLSLSGRLARVDHALSSLEEDAAGDERRTLMEKRQLLIEQHKDAKELKENLDRRERLVYDILATNLPEDDLADYQHFVKMKSSLIVEQRKLDDKIKLGEEQLTCLMDSLTIQQHLVF